jgi:hypothetical protein
MTNDQAVQLVKTARQKTDEMFNELLAQLRTPDSGPTETPARPGFVEPTAEEHGSEEPWSLPDHRFNGGWREIDRRESESYPWPDGHVDEYRPIVIYEGSGDFNGMRLALGRLPDGVIAGLVLGREGGSVRPITHFFPTNDSGETNEMISMIRGGGDRGRSGFAPDDPVPPVYAEFKVEVLGDRIEGKWKRLAIVVDADDTSSMLDHTAIQARLRRLA